MQTQRTYYLILEEISLSKIGQGVETHTYKVK